MVIPLTQHSFAPKPSLNCEHSLTASSGEYGEGFALVTDPSELLPEPHYLRHFNWCVKYMTIYRNVIFSAIPPLLFKYRLTRISTKSKGDNKRIFQRKNATKNKFAK